MVAVAIVGNFLPMYCPLQKWFCVYIALLQMHYLAIKAPTSCLLLLTTFFWEPSLVKPNVSVYVYIATIKALNRYIPPRENVKPSMNSEHLN